LEDKRSLLGRLVESSAVSRPIEWSCVWRCCEVLGIFVRGRVGRSRPLGTKFWASAGRGIIRFLFPVAKCKDSFRGCRIDWGEACCSRAVLIVGLGADFPQIVLRAGVGAGLAASRLRLVGSNVTVLSRGLGWDGSTRMFLTVEAKSLLVVDPANQLLPRMIFLRRSRIPSQDFAGIADGRMCEFGQLAVHSPVTWYRKHIGRSTFAT
jgi:hypothetical protein